MNKRITFRKGRRARAVIICLVMLAISSMLAVYPEILIRHPSMETAPIQIIGIISVSFFSALAYSFIRIIPRKFALVISEEYLMDHSKFEALGKIKWGDISKIQRKEKKLIEVFLKEPIFKRKNLSIIKKFLLIIQNWNYKRSILISSVLLDCSIEELEQMISGAYKKFKPK